MVPIILVVDSVNYHFLLVLNLMKQRMSLMNSQYLNSIQRIKFDEAILLVAKLH